MIFLIHNQPDPPLVVSIIEYPLGKCKGQHSSPHMEETCRFISGKA